MQTTIRGKLFPSSEQARQLRTLMNQQSSGMRFAYSRLQESKSKSEVEGMLSTFFPLLNGRYRQGAYFRAKFQFDAAKELVKSGLMHCSSKLVFGGRRNLERRAKGEISAEKWQQKRNNQLFCRGEISKGGNLNLRLVERDDGVFCLRVVVAPHRWVWIPAFVPNNKKRLLAGRQAYGVRILWRGGQDFELRVNFEADYPELVDFRSGAVGLDFNQDTIDLAVTDRRGQLQDVHSIECHVLTCARKAKRDHMIGIFAKRVVEYATYWQRGLVLEDLEDVARGKSNQHQFVHRKFLDAVKRRAEKEGVVYKEVNPAFTSVIGKWKYSSRYHITIHLAAAFVIARRGQGLREPLHGRLKTLILEAMEAGEIKESVLSRRRHSWSLWRVLNTLPFCKGTKLTHLTQAQLSTEMEQSEPRASSSLRRDDRQRRKTVTPGSGRPPPRRETA